MDRGPDRLGTLKDSVIRFRRIGTDAATGRFDEAAAEFKEYRKLAASMLPLSLTIAQQWSPFNPAVHYADYSALRQTLRQAEMVAQARAATADGAGERARQNRSRTVAEQRVTSTSRNWRSVTNVAE